MSLGFVNPFNIFVGRLTMQGIVTAPLINELTDGEGDWINDTVAIASWTIATAAIWKPVVTVAAKGGLVVHAVTTIGSAVGTATVVAAPFVAGAAIGAVVGTAVADEIWGPEGAQVALGFYSGGLLPETEAPNLTDFQYIIKPTAPGGPDSLYDIGKSASIGFKNAVSVVINKRRKRPLFYNPTPFSWKF
jgi:hypothetical protein